MATDALASVGVTRRGLWATATVSAWIIVGIVDAVTGRSASDVVAQMLAIPIGLGLGFWLIFPLIVSGARFGWYQPDPSLPPFPPMLPEAEGGSDQAKPAPVTARSSLSIASVGWVFLAIRSCLVPFAATARFFSRVLG
jgi:hypothetical protein